MTKLYQPSSKKIHSTNLYKFQSAVEEKFNRKFSNYQKFWQWSNQYPDQFWNFMVDHFNIPLTKKKTFKILNNKSEFWRTVFFEKSLANYYQLIFNLKQHHNWSIDEIENMIPWEREIYVTMLKQYIEEENRKMEQQNK